MCVRCDAPMKIETDLTLFAQPVNNVIWVCPCCGIKSRNTISS